MASVLSTSNITTLASIFNTPYHPLVPNAHMFSPTQVMKNVRDLQKACQDLLRAPHLPSLTHVAESLLGKPLDKTQQCSNWERRPLSHAQSQYAALDAHVLLSIASIAQLEVK